VVQNAGMQFSLFGAETAIPLVADLDGLLLAGGDWVRAERSTAARLSVLVADSWRADALRAEFASRGLDSDTAPAPGELIAVRSAFSPTLAEHAGRWTRGASLRTPVDLDLSASGLRLWAIAAGRSEANGYLLAMADADGTLHRGAGGQLARLGVAAVDVPARGARGGRSGPGWKITSAKRLRRLSELIGAPPPGAGADWPN